MASSMQHTFQARPGSMDIVTEGQSLRHSQQLVFLPLFSNPAKDSKRSENRHIVARWAMINRSTSSGQAPLDPDTRHNSGQPGVAAPLVSIPKTATHELPSLSTESTERQAFGKFKCSRPRNQSKQKPKQKQKQKPKPKTQTHSQPPESPQTTHRRLHDHSYYYNTFSTPSNTSGDFYSTDWKSQPATHDPFDSFPIQTNPHTQELLYAYLNAHFVFPATVAGEVGKIRRVKFFRQSTTFPLILQSDVTMNALVAYMESAPDLPIKSPNPDYLLHHVQAAYRGMQEALSRPNAEINDTICIAVILLVLAAQRSGDLESFRAHAKGLIQLLKARSRESRNSELQIDRERERWRALELTVNGPPSIDSCMFCKYAPAHPASPSGSPDVPEPLNVPGSSPSATNPTSLVIKAKFGDNPAQGAGFHDIISHDHLAPTIRSFIAQKLICTSISEWAHSDRLTAGVLCTHAWVDERPGKLPPLELAFFFSVRLCLYLRIRLIIHHRCIIVRHMVSIASGALQSPAVDISQLLEDCPYGALWLALVLGPLADDEATREWFQCLLARARHAVFPSGVCDFDELMPHMRNLFVWTDTMTPGTRKFWHENWWDAAAATAWMEQPF